jgi:signal transduction histidine kinase
MRAGSDPSSLVASNLDRIMAVWAARVRNELPGTRTLTDEELYNGLPDFLRNLALSFSVPKDSPEWQRVMQETFKVAERHGRQRANQATYTLDQVIAEHQILRRVLFQLVRARTSLKPGHLDTLLECVDVGISEAASAFALERGFKDARLRRAESERHAALGERNHARAQLSELRAERTLREQFVSTLSHDLRTPITSARLAAELIAREAGSTSGIERLASKVVDDLSRADRMIRDLLDANRIRSGEALPIEIRETELIALCRKTIQDLSAVYGERFRLHAGREITGYWSAPDLKRSLENLAINAVKYGARDAPVDVSVTEQGDQVSISVHNTGSVITPTEQEALFQPFSRIQRPGVRTRKGWGLGLTLVRGIAQAHGGKVTVESAADQGTTFTLLIPKDARRATDPALKAS